MMYAVIITDKNGSEEFERYYDKDHAEEIAHELTHQGDDTITAEIVEVEEKPKPKTKFELQDCYEPNKTCAIDLDAGDRSTCCGAEIVYFEAEYKRTSKGLFEVGEYNGCEECGAMVRLREMPERPEVKPYTEKEIFKAIHETWEIGADDVLKHNENWFASDVLDCVVSNLGRDVYSFTWDENRYEATRLEFPEQIEKATVRFDQRYNSH